MIPADTTAHVYLVCGPTDMRKGYDGLSGLVMGKVQGDPLSGHLFVFCKTAVMTMDIFDRLRRAGMPILPP